MYLYPLLHLHSYFCITYLLEYKLTYLEKIVNLLIDLHKINN